MDTTERFYRHLDKLKNQNPPVSFRTAVREVQSSFEEAMGGTPASLIEAIFLRFLDSFNQAGLPEDAFVSFSYRLGPYIDVFWKRYDEKEDPIPREEWVFLKEVVNEAAGDLDLKLLTYLMQLIMDKGLI